MPTQRHNYRNENLMLRGLLKLAYNALVVSDCLVPAPVRRWMKAQRQIDKLQQQQKAVDVRVNHMTPDLLQRTMREQGITEDDIKETLGDA